MTSKIDVFTPPLAERPQLQCYVDGSYVNGVTSFAWSLICNNQEIANRAAPVPKGLAQGSWQVGGELMAVMDAITFLVVDNRVKTIAIFYDYDGIYFWADRKWKAKKPLSQSYVSFMDAHRKNIHIDWVKVKAHSGNKWNDRVDFLAKQAAINGQQKK